MNTLVLLLMTTGAPAQTGTVIQSQPAPVIQTEPGSISSYDSGDAGWWGRFRNRPGLFSRMRGWFGRSQTSDQFPPGTTVYPGSTTVPGTTGESRLVPTPVINPPISSTPSITYGSGPYQAPGSVGNGPAFPLPSGRPQR